MFCLNVCMNVCTYVCMCTACMPGAHRSERGPLSLVRTGQKESPFPGAQGQKQDRSLVLGLGMVVNHSAGAGNKSLVLP